MNLQLSPGTRIKLLRLAAGYNQTRLAVLFECSQGNISKLEADELSVTIFQLECIRKVFGITADQFLDCQIDFDYVAFQSGNLKFSLQKHLPEIDLPEAA